MVLKELPESMQHKKIVLKVVLPTVFMNKSKTILVAIHSL